MMITPPSGLAERFPQVWFALSDALAGHMAGIVGLLLQERGR